METFQILRERPQAPLGRTPFHEWVFEDGTVWSQFFREESGYLLRFPDLADFQVSRDAMSVTCLPVPGVSPQTSQHLYLNQVLPLALSRRGNLVFHASAVEVEGRALAFLGPSGRGKSTLAATFATNGHRFLTDDGLIVRTHQTGYTVLPSHPSIRLWEDSSQNLVPSDAQTAPPLQFTSKLRFLAGEDISFCEKPCPLSAAYFLGDGSAGGIEIKRVNAAEALMGWVRNSFLLDMQEQQLVASHFDRVAELARRPICYSLDFPRRFQELALVRQAIIEHARQAYPPA